MHSNLLIERTEEPMRLFYYFLEGRCLFCLDAGDGARICFSRWSTRTTQLPRRMRGSVSWTTSTAATNSGPAPNKKKSWNSPFTAQFMSVRLLSCCVFFAEFHILYDHLMISKGLSCFFRNFDIFHNQDTPTYDFVQWKCFEISG